MRQQLKIMHGSCDAGMLRAGGALLSSQGYTPSNSQIVLTNITCPTYEYYSLSSCTSSISTDPMCNDHSYDGVIQCYGPGESSLIALELL